MREVQVPSFSPDPHAALEVVKLSQAQHYKPFYFLHIHMMQSIPRNDCLCKKWIPDYGTHAVCLWFVARSEKQGVREYGALPWFCR